MQLEYGEVWCVEQFRCGDRFFSDDIIVDMEYVDIVMGCSGYFNGYGGLDCIRFLREVSIIDIRMG